MRKYEKQPLWTFVEKYLLLIEQWQQWCLHRHEIPLFCKRSNKVVIFSNLIIWFFQFHIWVVFYYIRAWAVSTQIFKTKTRIKFIDNKSFKSCFITNFLPKNHLKKTAIMLRSSRPKNSSHSQIFSLGKEENAENDGITLFVLNMAFKLAQSSEFIKYCSNTILNSTWTFESYVMYENYISELFGFWFFVTSLEPGNRCPKLWNGFNLRDKPDRYSLMRMVFFNFKALLFCDFKKMFLLLIQCFKKKNVSHLWKNESHWFHIIISSCQSLR